MSSPEAGIMAQFSLLAVVSIRLTPFYPTRRLAVPFQAIFDRDHQGENLQACKQERPIHLSWGATPLGDRDDRTTTISRERGNSLSLNPGSFAVLTNRLAGFSLVG